MYAALGDREAQDEIRKENQHAGHCALLEKKSPSFCTNCPNNPFRIPDYSTPPPVANRYHAIQRAERMGAYLSRAMWLLDRNELGMNLDINSMRPTDFTMLRIAKRSWKTHEAMIQGRLVASEIAQIFSAMFGKK